MVGAVHGSKKNQKVLVPSHLLTNFEIQKYYQNKLKFNGVYSRNDLPKNIKDRIYIINLDKYTNASSH